MPRIPYFSDFMDYMDDMQQYANPRTKNWFMLFGNPIPVWILTAAYLIFVTYAGPKFMRNRKPYNLQLFMVVYNIGLVFLSVYMFVEMLLSTSAAGYQWLCSPYNNVTMMDPREERVTNVLWYYGISKAIELLDTVLMILRHKTNQVTFLHVFHHASMLNIWWWVPTFIPGGQTWFGSCLNCLVHIVMYSYYGLAVIPSLRKKLWWKKYITSFQLIQFVVTFLHSAQTFFSDCDFPLWGQYLLMNYMLVMLCLFGNFYFQSYINKSRRKHLEKSEETNGAVSNGKHVTNGQHETNGVQKTVRSRR